MFIIGIDPGLTGCIALIRHQPDQAIRPTLYVELADVPTKIRGKGGASVRREVDPIGASSLFVKWRKEHFRMGRLDNCCVVIEYQSSRPGQASGSGFSSGDTFGCLRAVAALQGWPVHFVMAVVWKRYYGLIKEKGGPEIPVIEKKRRARERAIAIYPDAPLERAKDHNRAEALLIAQYGSRFLI